MYPSAFDYYRPTSVPDAIRLLQENPEGKILAGGHSLLPMMKLRLANPAALIDIGRIEGLSGIKVNDGQTVIGPTTTYHEILESDDIRRALPILAETANVVGDVQVRNRGTIGGSVAHADPAADFPALMLALDAAMKAVGPKGEREIKADDFFVDMFTTQLQPDEVLTEIVIPNPGQRTGTAYEKFAHPASGYAVVGVAAAVKLGQDGKVESARVAVTGAGPIATRATAAENALTGQQPTDDAIKAAAAKASDGMTFLGDIYAGEDYRAHLTRVFAERALKRAAAQAQG